MNKYEAMFILKSDLSEEERKTLFNQISDVVVKLQGTVSEAAIWADKRKFVFPIKRQAEGLYYLMGFEINPSAIDKMHYAYKLNELVLRVLISRL